MVRASTVIGSETQLKTVARNLRKPWIAIALATLLVITVALLFANPIQDGDLFWHMAYAQQMIQRGTLRTDHTLYSWMPAANNMIYCAWVGEFVLLGVWKAFGVAGMFALRYLVVLAVLGMLCRYAWQAELLGRAELWLIFLVTILASAAPTVPKPELFSLALWNGLVFIWFQILRRVQTGGGTVGWIYAIPCLILLWVNTHGAFILAAPFVAIIGIWGWLQFPPRLARHLAIAVLLCAAATAINPYGIRYPLEQIHMALGSGLRRPDVAWNNAYQPAWSEAGRYDHYPELLGWMTLGLIAAMWRRPRGWIGIAVLFLAYVPLYLIYLRGTFFLPAIFGFGMIHLLRGTKTRQWIGVAACPLFLFLACRVVYQQKFDPPNDEWMGFGISYVNPVDEADFLASHNFGPRIYNTFNVGGYLIWRLYPRYKVMVDSRSFPYLGWFDELYQFQRDKDPKVFQSFLDRHPADVALVDFQEGQTWRSFLAAPGWRPAFYGPSAAVFVRVDSGIDRIQSAESLQHLRNGAAGVEVFKFARAVGDYRTAWSVLDQLQGSLSGQVQTDDLQPLLEYRQAHAALRAGQYSLAWDRFSKSFEHSAIVGNDMSLLVILRARLKLGDANPQEAVKLDAALSRLAASQ